MPLSSGANRVFEKSTFSGNTAYTFGGIYSGFGGQAFASGLSGQWVSVTAVDGSGLLWEQIKGFVSGGGIAKTYIEASCSGGALTWPNNAVKAIALTPHISDYTYINASGSMLTIGSGAVFSTQLASGSVLSGSIGSGQVGQFHLASGSVNSGAIASGQLGPFHHASGSILSGHIASGQIGQFHIASGAVTSGNIASGQLSLFKFASGTPAQLTGPFISGSNYTLTTEETVSGLRAVSISQSGKLRIAMAGVSGRMPAIGIVADNCLSGIQANVYTGGVFQASSGMVDYSGYLGRNLYVGRSGHIVSVSGSFNSGGLLSGDIWQAVGVPFNSGGVVFGPQQNMFTLISG